MQVTIRWREVNDYTSTITIDDAEFGAYVKAGRSDKQLIEGRIRDYLEDGDESLWFDRTDLNRDFDGTAERFITDVTSYEGEPT